MSVIDQQVRMLIGDLEITIIALRAEIAELKQKLADGEKKDEAPTA
jgi:hypothetical protein